MAGNHAVGDDSDREFNLMIDCVAYIASTCPNGVGCGNRHSEAARHNPAVCMFWLNGTCRNGVACPYRHPTKPKPGAGGNGGQGVKPCIFHLRGYCAKGSWCPFYHQKDGHLLGSAAISSVKPEGPGGAIKRGLGELGGGGDSAPPAKRAPLPPGIASFAARRDGAWGAGAAEVERPEEGEVLPEEAEAPPPRFGAAAAKRARELLAEKTKGRPAPGEEGGGSPAPTPIAFEAKPAAAAKRAPIVFGAAAGGGDGAAAGGALQASRPRLLEKRALEPLPGGGRAGRMAERRPLEAGPDPVTATPPVRAPAPTAPVPAAPAPGGAAEGKKPRPLEWKPVVREQPKPAPTPAVAGGARVEAPAKVRGGGGQVGAEEPGAPAARRKREAITFAPPKALGALKAEGPRGRAAAGTAAGTAAGVGAGGGAGMGRGRGKAATSREGAPPGAAAPSPAAATGGPPVSCRTVEPARTASPAGATPQAKPGGRRKLKRGPSLTEEAEELEWDDGEDNVLEDEEEDDFDRQMREMDAALQ